MWFKKLTGFEEISPENVKENIIIDGQSLTSKVNGKSYQFGELQVPSLESLREEGEAYRESFDSKIKVTEVVADIQQLHINPANKNALFQVASQFNLLEMVGPEVTPERGVDIYDRDLTQGPACAIACGASTIYRNYFANVNGEIGQTRNNQIDCLEDIGRELNNDKLQLWEMKNGYALASQEGILNINKQLRKLSYNQREQLKGKLKIGLQRGAEVTISNTNQIVSQAYCSALPVAYSNIEFFYWENFARLILEASYEATLYSALKNYKKSNKVFLTLVGGGAFGNEIDWILDSLFKAINKFKNTPLDVKIVSYGRSNSLLKSKIGGYFV